jgi:hypothetical protein
VIDLRRLLTSVVIATLVLIVLLGVRPLRLETILAGYALALAAIALAGLTSAITDARESAPSRFEHELTRERVPPTRPPDLVRMERELTLGASSGLHFHTRLAPLLSSIAEARGGSLDDADLPPRDDPSAPGLPMRRIRQIVDRLEAL